MLGFYLAVVSRTEFESKVPCLHLKLKMTISQTCCTMLRADHLLVKPLVHTLTLGAAGPHLLYKGMISAKSRL